MKTIPASIPVPNEIRHFPLAKLSIFAMERTAPIFNSRPVLSMANLLYLALAKLSAFYCHRYISFFALTLCLFSATFLAALSPGIPGDLTTAVANQKAATTSSSLAEQQQLLNTALAVYLPAAEKQPSGYLLGNIGLAYLSLHDYGLSIAYLQKAATFLPRDAVIQKYLHLAITQADAQNLQINRPISDFIGFRWCSPIERTSIAIGGLVLTLIFFSLNVWTPFSNGPFLWRTSALLTLGFIAALLYHALFVPPQAIAIRAAPVETFSLKTAESVQDIVRPGEALEVIGVNEVGDRLLVRTANGTTGYVIKNNVCFIL